MREIFALDVETAAKDPKYQQFGALEPWRVLQNKAHITSLSICRPDTSVLSLHRRKMGDASFEHAIAVALDELNGKIVYAHNAVFDAAWTTATLKNGRCDSIPEVVRAVQWHDTMLLGKWIINGQRAEDMQFSYSLMNMIQSFLRDHPLCEEFVRMKSEKVDPGYDPYWERRNELDVVMTRELAVFLENKLPEEQRRGYGTEMRNILPVANSWIVGLRIDQEKLEQVEHNFSKEQAEILSRIQITPSTLTSPKQLAHLLFTQLKLTPIKHTPTGSPSTAADDLKLIGFQLQQAGNEKLAKFMTDVCRYKQIATLQSKYIKGAKNALAHTGDGFIYGAPRIAGTYTGRFTYSSTTLDTWQTGIALHQVPRKDKDVRSLIIPPEGFDVYEADASGQESRLMAIRSGDPNMLWVFQNGFDLHAMTGSFIVGMEYDDLMSAYKSGDERAREYRQMGKLTNLSSNFRTGGKKLAKKAFDDYDMPMSIDQGYFISKTFQSRYANVPKYWDEAIQHAKAFGYTEAFGGRRYKIYDWSEKRVWQSESSALMFPIQGSGASMKNIAIAETFAACPEAIFALDLHDAGFFWAPKESVHAIKSRMDEVLANIDYEKYWGFKPPIALPYDSMIGNNLADVK